VNFEIQAQIFTLKNHQEALQMIETATRSLIGFRPYVEFEAIVGVRYGNARFDKANGSWLYVGEVYALCLDAAAAQLTPLKTIDLDPIVVQVGLFNDGAIAVLQNDCNWELS
jgi:hypothetical protein